MFAACVSYAQDEDYFTYRSAILYVDPFDNDTSFIMKDPIVFRAGDKLVKLAMGYYKSAVPYVVIEKQNLGGCITTGALLLMITDGAVLNLSEDQTFNCDDLFVMPITHRQADILKKKPLKKIRFTNKLTFDSLTANVPSGKSGALGTFITDREMFLKIKSF